MANYDELLELVYERVDGNKTREKYGDIKGMMVDFKKAKKEKDFKKMKKILSDAEKSADRILSDIDDMTEEAGSRPKTIEVCAALSAMLLVLSVGTKVAADVTSDKIAKTHANSIFDPSTDPDEILQGISTMRNDISKVTKISNAVASIGAGVAIATGSAAAAVNTQDAKQVRGMFRMARSEMTRIAKSVKGMLSKMQKDIEKIEQLSTRPLKESTGPDTEIQIKLAIYESEAAGEITAEERSLLLGRIVEK